MATQAPIVVTGHACYSVGQLVEVAGAGFAPDRLYDVAIDGVDFGQSHTSGMGTFVTSLIPGGLGAGVVQAVDALNATDGTREADTTFTVTRRPGARLLAVGGSARPSRERFQVWGFGLHAKPGREIYVHYVAPSGRARTTVALGRTGGQCGYLLTRPMPAFPFTPSAGTWRLQVDVSREYSRRPAGPVAQIRVRVAKG